MRYFSTISYEDWIGHFERDQLKEVINNMADSIPSELPELSQLVKKEISKVPFSLKELASRTKKEALIEKKEISLDLNTEYRTITINGEERQIKKKNRPIQKKEKLADTLFAFKLKLGLSVDSILFYRYVRVPKEKRNDKNWKGIKRDACILIFANSSPSFTFTYAICNEKDKFTLDEARKRCQDRMRGGLSITVSNFDKDSSHLENIRRATNNYFFGANKRPEEPIVHSIRVNNNRSFKQLGMLIKQKFNLGI